jgi:exoribonuclease-2
LTFKITLANNGEIDEIDTFPSTVKGKRLTYKEADELIYTYNDMYNDTYKYTHNNMESIAILHTLCTLAERNLNRRLASGAVSIDLPETQISLNEGRVAIEPIVPYRSADMVRECMLLAGEGAGLWAARHNLAIPYVVQETGNVPGNLPGNVPNESPGDILAGLAGSYQLRRCMRPRNLSTKPGHHWGLGLDTYVQVTSPLRRYTDLLTHIQIRTVLRGGNPLGADEVMARMNAGDAAAAAVTQAERASRRHWTMVHLADKKDSIWDAVALEKKGNRWVVIIPSIALETQVPLRTDAAPNDHLKLTLKSVNIPKAEAMFVT